jgi:hypothetical protein
LPLSQIYGFPTADDFILEHMIYVIGSTFAPSEVFAMDVGSPVDDQVARSTVPVSN